MNAAELFVEPLPRRRRGLWLFAMCLVLLVVALGTIAKQHLSCWLARDAVRGIQSHGGEVWFFHEASRTSPAMRVLFGNDLHKNVLSVELTSAEITNQDLRFCRVLPKVRILDLSSTSIDNAGIPDIACLHSLFQLDLSDTNVGDEGLKRLAGLQKLQYLELAGTKVTDAGLVHLQKMKNLHGLGLMDTQVTEAGLMKLHAALPALQLGYGVRQRYQPESDSVLPAEIQAMLEQAAAKQVEKSNPEQP